MKKKIGQGCECTVYDVGDGTVFKDYDQRQLSHNEAVKYVHVCFELQSIAAEQGLAPRAIRISGTGYYSEKVKPLDSLDNYMDKYPQSIVDVLHNTIDQLSGTGWFDMKDDNLGILSDGTLCVIDFGLLGFVSTKTGSNLMAKHDVVRY